MLVRITGEKNKEILTTTSREVAEVFEKRHDKLISEIERMYFNLTDKGCAQNGGDPLFIKTEYIHEQNHQKYPMYLMTRDGFSLLAMGFTGEKALKWKLQYITAFNEMENELKRIYEERKLWEIERAKGVVIRHILTDTIKMNISESPHKEFMYPNYTKLIYSVIFGKSMNELRREYGVKPKETIRDYLSTEQLKEIENMEMLVSSLINCGWDYNRIKEFIKANCVDKLN